MFVLVTAKMAVDRRLEAGILALKVGNEEEAIKILTPIARLRNNLAQSLLAQIYACEINNTPFDAEMAGYWLLMSGGIDTAGMDKSAFKEAVMCPSK